jgi:hypothetical protein
MFAETGIPHVVSGCGQKFGSLFSYGLIEGFQCCE